MPVSFAVQSPEGIPGAIALVHLAGDSPSELDQLFVALEIRPVPSGASRLGRLRMGEQLVIARWSPLEAHLMPHGGTEVMRRVVAALAAAGALQHKQFASSPGPDDPTAHLADAIANAASPLAIDLLLDQPRRWAASPRVMVSPAHASMLRHLLHAPLVVAWGPPNVGKSTLLNALARQQLAIVAPEPGTTRDHVGALLNVGGLVIRYADTPGVRSDPHPAEAEAIEIARALASSADLLLWCRDAASPRPPLPPTRALVLPLDLRSDIAIPPGPPGISVSSLDEGSIHSLSLAIREVLVPASAQNDPGAWAFWHP